MSELYSFPPEVLSLITASLSGHGIGKLWMCGSPRIIRNMLHEGVLKFEIEGAVSSWPRISLLFPLLQEFSCVFMHPMPEKLIERDIMQLPASLRSLRLILSNSPIMGSNSLISRFSELISLELGFESSYHPDIMRKMPKHLQKLEICLDNLPSDFSFVSCLQLQSLKLMLRDLDHVNIDARPLSQLTLFHVQLDSSVPYVAHLPIFEFPKSLLDFKQNYSWQEMQFNQTNHLQSLQFALHIFRSQPFLQLPFYLVHLIVSGQIMHQSNCYLSEDNIAGLPRTLRTLHLPENVHILVQASPLLPNGLLSLRSAFVQGLQGLFRSSYSDQLEERLELPRPLLPPSLTEFLATHVDDPETDVPVMPEHSLTKLKLGFVMLRREFLIWPSTITSFAAFIAETETNWTNTSVPLCVEALEEHRRAWNPQNGAFLLVPANCLELDLYVENTILLTYLLPPSLTRLSLTLNQERICEENMFPPGWSRLLPTTITSLCLENLYVSQDFFDHQQLKKLQSLKITPGADFSLQNLTCYPLLEILNIQFCGIVDWQGVDLSSMTKLQLMDIKAKGDLLCPVSGWIPLLPPKLLVFFNRGHRIHPLNMQTNLDDFKRAKIHFVE